jgi:hypothetical protein
MISVFINKKTRVAVYIRVGDEKYAQKLKEQEVKRSEQRLQMISLFNQWKNETYRGYRCCFSYRSQVERELKKEK